MSCAVTVYSIPYCPESRELKSWLHWIGVPFYDRDIGDPNIKAEVHQRFGATESPITEIGDWAVRGRFAEQMPQIEARLQTIGAWPF
jgi:glutaredoxin